jgi:hypothetical protein
MGNRSPFLAGFATIAVRCSYGAAPGSFAAQKSTAQPTTAIAPLMQIENNPGIVFI